MATLKLIVGLVSIGVMLPLGHVTSSSASKSVQASYRAGNGPVSVAIGDLNGDGRPDLATANLYANTISVLVRTRVGTFQPRRDFRAGGDPRAVAIDDLDGDGARDLVAVNHTDPGAVSVLLNARGGGFRRRGDFPTSSGPVAAAIGDLNGDGRADVVTANRTATVLLLYNRGRGALEASRRYRTGLEPVSVKIGDLNGDRRRDLVTANFGSNTVSVLINKGDGGFGAKRDYATGLRPTAVAIGDLDGDGRPDLATANLEGSTVSVLLNRGSGRFRQGGEHKAGGDPRSIAIGDLNGDRKRDVVTVNAEASTVSVLLNSGDGTFQAPHDSATGRYPVSVAVGDLDDDESPDAVTANLGAGTVSVLPGSELVRGDEPRPNPPPPAPAPAPGLLLWNKLGSASEIAHSAYGPNLRRFDCRDRTAPHFDSRCTIDRTGVLSHPAGVFGGAASIARGPYRTQTRIHAALLRTSILNPEHGAVEAWYRQKGDPVPSKHNPHRIFGGPYSLTGVDEVELYAQDRLDSDDPRLHFAVWFGEEPPPSTPAKFVAVRSLADRGLGYRISALNGRWIHVAGVWDRRGIGGSIDTVRLYVDGEVVAAARAKNWGTTPCGRRVSARPAGACFIDVAGCNDTCAGRFSVDNLKVWSYAKTDYGDRFVE